MTSGFAPGVTEKLKYYVYLLIDPRDDAIFYVGKGIGDRCFSHVTAARETNRDSDGEFPKLERIRAIDESENEVRVEILRYALDETTAFEVESAAIELLPGLTNLVTGRDSQRRGVDDINGDLGATPVVIAPEHRVILIRVAREYRPGMSADELYEKTRKWWHVSKRWTDLTSPEAPEYAFSVAGGVVRAVFKITAWEDAPEADIAEDESRRGRRIFTGHRDPAMNRQYRWGDVTAYLPQGAQNPISYANCAAHTPTRP